jgi:predicted nuclease of predicted toxin-antitoxin system
VKVLLDENLSPTQVQRLAAKGVAAVHVAHLGRSGATDPEVWEYAFEHDQIVVTINASDFLRLAERGDLHAGLVVFRVGGLSRTEQWAWLEPVVDHLLEEGGSLVNRAVVVNGPSRFTFVDLPPPRR